MGKEETEMEGSDDGNKSGRGLSNFRRIVKLIRSYFTWLIDRLSQTLLIISAAIGYYIYKAIARPKGFITAMVGMFLSEIPHYFAFGQWIVAILVYFANGGIKRMTGFTKFLFMANLFVSGLHALEVREMFRSYGYFQQALAAKRFDTSFFTPQTRFLLPKKLESSVGQWFTNVSATTAMFLSLFPFLSKKRRLVSSFKQKSATYDNIDHNLQQETKPYAEMKTLDPHLLQRIKTSPKSARATMALMGRGDQRGWLDLDILRNHSILRKLKKDPERQNVRFPVVIYVHGGGFVTGDKGFALKGSMDFLGDQFNVVVVKINYRMAPERTIPEQILDVKRAICWVKNNISKYGGDSSKICLAGESAGAHLSALAGVTNNGIKFRQMFEDCVYTADLDEVLENSAVDLVVDIGGIHDLAKGENEFVNLSMSKWKSGALVLSERMALQKKFSQDPEFFNLFSPTRVLLQILEKHKTGESSLKESAANVPPYMIIHATKDALTSVKDAKEFYEILKRYRLLMGESETKKDLFVDFHGAHHAVGYLDSPRAASMAIGIASFMKTYFESVESVTSKL